MEERSANTTWPGLSEGHLEFTVVFLEEILLPNRLLLLAELRALCT